MSFEAYTLDEDNEVSFARAKLAVLLEAIAHGEALVDVLFMERDVERRESPDMPGVMQVRPTGKYRCSIEFRGLAGDWVDERAKTE